ncbi:hypothetical protein [Devosia lucknowensis]|nr:hypothetical protein [Devosia lucknowensis]
MPKRLVALIFPVLILGIAVGVTPTFIAEGLAWWPVFIFGLPAMLSIVMCVEYWNASIAMDENGLRFQSVGYGIAARWDQVSVREGNGKTSLLLTDATPEFRPWMGAMYQVLTVFMAPRARYARGLMALVPLSLFSTGPDDAVMREFRRFFPAQGT